MADVSPEHTDGLKKLYENSLGLCGFSKTEIAHTLQAQSAANPACARFLPKLQFQGVTAPTGAEMSGMHGMPGIPGDLGNAVDPTGITGIFAQFMHFLEGMAAFPDAEQLLDPAIANEVAAEALKKAI